MPLTKFPNDRQLDAMDCGPACLKMLAKYYGKYYSLQYLRDKCGTTKEGISFLDLSYAAEEIGLRTLSVKATVGDLLFRVPLPVVVHWDNSHFVVVYKVKAVNGENKDTQNQIPQGTIYVSDPAKGYVKYNTKDFAKKWIKTEHTWGISAVDSNKSGVLMAMEPQTEFYQKQVAEKTEHLKTFTNFFGYFRPYKKSFVNLGVVMLLVTILQGFLPFISKAVIDVGIQTHDLDFINIVLYANIAIYVSILLSNIVRDWILLHITSRINIALISDYLIKLMLLPITFFENKMTGDILQRAQDHERIRSFIMNNSLNMVFSTLTFIVFGVILFFYNTTIFYVFLVGSVLIYYLGNGFFKDP